MEELRPRHFNIGLYRQICEPQYGPSSPLWKGTRLIVIDIRMGRCTATTEKDYATEYTRRRRTQCFILRQEPAFSDTVLSGLCAKLEAMDIVVSNGDSS